LSAALLVLPVAGAALLLGGIALAAIAADEPTLTRLSGLAEVGGGIVLAAGLAASFVRWLHRRLFGVRSPTDPVDLLARRVWQAEVAARTALVGATAPAVLAFDRDPSSDTGRSRSRQRSRARTRGGRAVKLPVIGEFYTQLQTRRLVVLGAPGAGKTVAAIELVLQLLAARKPARGDQAMAVPVRLAAASWDPTRRLDDWLAERLLLDYGLPSPAVARQLVEDRLVVPVLDGLDELDPDNPRSGDHDQETPPRRAQAALDQLEGFLRDGGPSGAAVVTCRADRYAHLARLGARLREATVLRVRPLTPEKIRAYVNASLIEDPRQQAAWRPLLAVLDQPAGTGLRSVLSSPWRLLLASTIAEAGRPLTALVDATADTTPLAALAGADRVLLAGYVPAATRLTARTRRWRTRGRERRYDPERVTVWLRQLADQLAWQGEQVTNSKRPPTGLSGVDLVPHLLWPVGGRRLVRALHGALGVLAGVVVGVAFAWWTLEPAGLLVFLLQVREYSGLEIALIVDGFYALLLLGLPLMVGAACWERWGHPMLVTPSVRWVPWWRRVVAAAVLALLIGAVVMALGLSMGLWLMGFWGFALSLRFALVVAALAGLFVALGPGLRMLVDSDVGRRLLGAGEPPPFPSPFYALRSQRAGVANVSLWSGLGGFGVAWLAGVPAIDCVRAGAAFAAGLLLLLLTISARYRIGMLVGAVRRQLPLRMARFLTWGCEAGLLRVAGGAYQFRHHELQHWCTSSVHTPGQSETPRGSQDDRVSPAAR
jgi:hypothetical protein